MTLFLEGNIWVWKCLFMLESKYKHITYTHWCTHLHMGRSLCVWMCARRREFLSKYLRHVYSHLLMNSICLHMWSSALAQRDCCVYVCELYRDTTGLKEAPAASDMEALSTWLSPEISSKALTGIILLTPGLSLTSRSQNSVQRVKSYSH